MYEIQSLGKETPLKTEDSEVALATHTKRKCFKHGETGHLRKDCSGNNNVQMLI